MLFVAIEGYLDILLEFVTRAEVNDMGFEEESPQDQLSEDELYVLYDIHAMPRSKISAPLKIEDKDCPKQLDQDRREGERRVRSHRPQVPDVYFFCWSKIKTREFSVLFYSNSLIV